MQAAVADFIAAITAQSSCSKPCLSPVNQSLLSVILGWVNLNLLRALIHLF